jgi:hypothetical protein
MTRRTWYSRSTSPLDEVAAERLLRGQLPSVGASSDEQALAKLLAAASAPPSVHELSGEPRAVAAYIATRPASTGPRHARHVLRRRRPVINSRVSHGVAAAAALGALTVGGVAAAAYTGSLPGSMQRLAHDHLGAPRQHPKPPPTIATSHQTPTQTALRSHGSPDDKGQPGLSAVTPPPAATSAGRGSSTNGLRSQRYLLCTAYTTAHSHGTKADVDEALRQLVKAAGGHTKVLDYCAPIWHTNQYPNDPHDPVYPSAHPPLTTAPGATDGQSPH